MNEHEFRSALRGVMVAGSPPPPMSPEEALDVARHASRRRRTVLAGTAAALAVVLIAIGTTVAPGLPHLRPDRVGQAAGPSQLPGTEVPPEPGTVPPSTQTGTESVWPTGPDGAPQSDRTSHAGPRYESAARLLDELVAVAPPGYAIPEQTNYQPPGSNADPEVAHSYWGRAHQAQFAELVGGQEVWEYLATLSVSRDGGIGGLQVEVRTRHNQLPSDGCALARTMAMNDALACEAIPVGDVVVGVVRPVTVQVGEGTFDLGVDQLAAFRHADGTVVVVAQKRVFWDEPGLASLPLSTQRLAELAADPRFLVD